MCGARGDASRSRIGDYGAPEHVKYSMIAALARTGAFAVLSPPLPMALAFRQSCPESDFLLVFTILVVQPRGPKKSSALRRAGLYARATPQSSVRWRRRRDPTKVPHRGNDHGTLWRSIHV